MTAPHDVGAFRVGTWWIRGDLPAVVGPVTVPRTVWNELRADALLIDERRGRAVATFRGLSVIGTLGIVAGAKRAGVLERQRSSAGEPAGALVVGVEPGR